MARLGCQLPLSSKATFRGSEGEKEVNAVVGCTVLFESFVSGPWDSRVL